MLKKQLSSTKRRLPPVIQTEQANKGSKSGDESLIAPASPLNKRAESVPPQASSGWDQPSIARVKSVGAPGSVHAEPRTFHSTTAESAAENKQALKQPLLPLTNSSITVTIKDPDLKETPQSPVPKTSSGWDFVKKIKYFLSPKPPENMSVQEEQTRPPAQTATSQSWLGSMCTKIRSLCGSRPPHDPDESALVPEESQESQPKLLAGVTVFSLFFATACVGYSNFFGFLTFSNFFSSFIPDFLLSAVKNNDIYTLTQGIESLDGWTKTMMNTFVSVGSVASITSWVTNIFQAMVSLDSLQRMQPYLIPICEKIQRCGLRELTFRDNTIIFAVFLAIGAAFVAGLAVYDTTAKAETSLIREFYSPISGILNGLLNFLTRIPTTIKDLLTFRRIYHPIDRELLSLMERLSPIVQAVQYAARPSEFQFYNNRSPLQLADIPDHLQNTFQETLQTLQKICEKIKSDSPVNLDNILRALIAKERADKQYLNQFKHYAHIFITHAIASITWVLFFEKLAHLIGDFHDHFGYLGQGIDEFVNVVWNIARIIPSLLVGYPQFTVFRNTNDAFLSLLSDSIALTSKKVVFALEMFVLFTAFNLFNLMVTTANNDPFLPLPSPETWEGMLLLSLCLLNGFEANSVFLFRVAILKNPIEHDNIDLGTNFAHQTIENIKKGKSPALLLEGVNQQSTPTTSQSRSPSSAAGTPPLGDTQRGEVRPSSPPSSPDIEEARKDSFHIRDPKSSPGTDSESKGEGAESLSLAELLSYFNKKVAVLVDASDPDMPRITKTSFGMFKSPHPVSAKTPLLAAPSVTTPSVSSASTPLLPPSSSVAEVDRLPVRWGQGWS